MDPRSVAEKLQSSWQRTGARQGEHWRGELIGYGIEGECGEDDNFELYVIQLLVAIKSYLYFKKKKKKMMVEVMDNHHLEHGQWNLQQGPVLAAIYIIIRLKSVCLSLFADCRPQFLLNPTGRYFKLFVSTV